MRSGVPPLGDTRMMTLPSGESCAKTIAFSPHVMPYGFRAGQIVVAAPPLMATFLMVLSTDAKNASDCPSGENTGSVTFDSASVPGMGLASKSLIDRRYRRFPATNAIRAPSGETAT